MKSNILFILTAAIIIFLKPVYSQPVFEKEVVELESFLSLDKIYPSAEFKAALEIDIDAGWHINSNKPKEELLIPTKVWLPNDSEFKLLKTIYPEAHDYQFGFSEVPVSVWQGKVYFCLLMKANKNLS